MSDALIAAAINAMPLAYAPYSQFQVGAAIEDENGHIHTGVNVENAAYPVGSCAEAGAIAAMIGAGGRKITRIAVAGRGDLYVPLAVDAASGYANLPPQIWIFSSVMNRACASASPLLNYCPTALAPIILAKSLSLVQVL